MCRALTMMLEEERNVGVVEGKAYGILDILSEYSSVPKTDEAAGGCRRLFHANHRT